MEKTKLGFAQSLLAVCGILTISFPLTWGLWSEFHPISHYINRHAIYIAATGVGLLCSLAINVSLQRRIEALERASNSRPGLNPRKATD
jgi:formate hydrogenlyase subunit 3/multisubunit Na+/H+ antiporter MnhD subunit